MLTAFLLTAVLTVAAPAQEPPSLAQQIAQVLPTEEEDRWLQVPWRTNLMQARLEAQQTGKPVFLWIMVGNPQGCT